MMYGGRRFQYQHGSQTIVVLFIRVQSLTLSLGDLTELWQCAIPLWSLTVGKKPGPNRVNVLLSSKIYMIVQLFIFIEDNVTCCCYSTYVVMYTLRLCVGLITL